MSRATRASCRSHLAHGAAAIIAAMESNPRPLDELDCLLGADAAAAASHALGHFEPRLPAGAAEAAFGTLVARYTLRWREYWGPVGERIRVLEADGLIRVDRARGVIIDPDSNQPLHTLPSSPPS